jgi:hypothetical protein
MDYSYSFWTGSCWTSDWIAADTDLQAKARLASIMDEFPGAQDPHLEQEGRDVPFEYE